MKTHCREKAVNPESFRGKKPQNEDSCLCRPRGVRKDDENIRGLQNEQVFGGGAEHGIPIRNRDVRSPGHSKVEKT